MSIKEKADLIVNPLGMRVVRLLNGQTLSIKDIQEKLSDVPQATLYRYINKMTGAGIIVVAEVKKVRATLKKYYTLPEGGAYFNKQEAEEFTKDDLQDLFTQFTASLIHDFSAYLKANDHEGVRRNMGFRQSSLHLTDEQFHALTKELSAVFARYVEAPRAENAEEYLFSSIVFRNETE
jgi:predicted DNA-binding transcriptional regulator YafY